MKNTTKLTFLILAILLLTGCNFIKNSFSYKSKTKDFVETILDGNYYKAIDHFATEHEFAKNMDIEQMKNQLVFFRKAIDRSFGKDLNYKFIKAAKMHDMAPNTTLAFIQISNEEQFGVLEVLFDDISGKILNINLPNNTQPIPNMVLFWLFGLLALCIPAFNIYVIIQIKRSNLKRKWLKYLTVIILNVPSISFNPIFGLSFNPLNFNILLGISFSYMGYLTAAWSFGIPLGGIYWLWRLKRKKNENLENENISTEEI